MICTALRKFLSKYFICRENFLIWKLILKFNLFFKSWKKEKEYKKYIIFCNRNVGSSRNDDQARYMANSLCYKADFISCRRSIFETVEVLFKSNAVGLRNSLILFFCMKKVSRSRLYHIWNSFLCRDKFRSFWYEKWFEC